MLLFQPIPSNGERERETIKVDDVEYGRESRLGARVQRLSSAAPLRETNSHLKNYNTASSQLRSVSSAALASIMQSNQKAPRVVVEEKEAAAIQPPIPMSSSPLPLPSHVPRMNDPDRYVLSPTVAELQSLTVEALQEVHNFTVGLPDGKVRVTFLAPVCLVSCVIDECLDLTRDGKAEFYPPPMSPPEIGQGLMVEALVHVEGTVGVTPDDLREHCRVYGTILDGYVDDVWSYIINRVNNPLTMDGTDITVVTLQPTSPLPAESIQWWNSPVYQQTVAPVSTLIRPVLSSQVGDSFTFGEQEQDGDIELPYDLPPLLPAVVTDTERPLVFVVPELRKAPAEVLLVHKDSSFSLPRAIGANTREVVGSNTDLFLGRSFRCGFNVGGLLAIPSFALLRDLGAPDHSVPAVSGAAIRFVMPFTTMVTTGYSLVLQFFASHYDSAAAVINFGHPSRKGFLSNNKLDQLLLLLKSAALPPQVESQKLLL